MQHPGGVLLAAGWTAATHIFSFAYAKENANRIHHPQIIALFLVLVSVVCYTEAKEVFADVPTD